MPLFILFFICGGSSWDRIIYSFFFGLAHIFQYLSKALFILLLIINFKRRSILKKTLYLFPHCFFKGN